MTNVQLKPFIKWAGGKGQLLKNIRGHYPRGLGSTITKYAEPFIGGGAVLFDILSTFNMKDIYISDTNFELINTYIVIRDDIDELIKILSLIKNEYLPLDMERRKPYYYEKRELFNRMKTSFDKKNAIEEAALFIFLNKTCFNGLYRVNSKGLYNVPIGSYKSPCICDENNLRNISTALKNVKIICGDYRASANFIDENTFVYFDPPYRPLTQTANFTSYTENLFNDKAQSELCGYVNFLDQKKARVILSNSDPRNSDINDDFFDNLYKNHRINRVKATRMINCNGASRGKISELLIVNYLNKEIIVRDFDEWISRFRTSISGYDYYVNFDKVTENVKKIKVELNILNSLIGSVNIEDEFEQLIKNYPETLKCIPLLLAVRENEIFAQDDDGDFKYNFTKMNYTVEQYKVFMRKTGLFDLISKHLVNNLVDYALGVETGLDSNGRKNRGGHLMENLVESYIKKAGFKNQINYFKEMYLSDIEKQWDIDLSALSNHGKTRKRFDFVIKTDTMIYAIETNFYGSIGGGSKLNETARSYKLLAQESQTVDGFTFVWFTDGTAWKSARGNLRETFDILDTIYNIDDMENGIMTEVFL